VTSTLRSEKASARALAVASALFYANGVRAVGMEQIVEVSGIAKTTIYRHFPTKDALIEAFLEKEDAEFWSQWDAVIAEADTAVDRLDALCDWIAVRVTRDGYRGCPQVNVAAELADPTHPARLVARRHKAEMQRRLAALCEDLPDAATVSMQIALLFDGAFMSDGRLRDVDAGDLLRGAVRRLTGLATDANPRHRTDSGRVS